MNSMFIRALNHKFESFNDKFTSRAVWAVSDNVLERYLLNELALGAFGELGSDAAGVYNRNSFMMLNEREC